MRVETLFFGEPYCRSYALIEGDQCLLFDCGHPGVLRYLEKNALQCLGLFLTHGHFDHIAGLVGQEGKLGFPLYIAEEDEVCLEDPYLNASRGFGLPEVALDAAGFDVKSFDDGEEIVLGPFHLKAIKTPFHTLGSSVFYLAKEGLLFTGDSLFHLGIGRSDLPHAAPRLLCQSLAKIMALPEQTRFFPGHGRGASLKEEASGNPYLGNGPIQG